MNLICLKSDYSDSSMSLNTGGAKLFNDVLKEMGLLTPRSVTSTRRAAAI